MEKRGLFVVLPLADYSNKNITHKIKLSMENEKQLKIDALMQSIEKRIEVNQSVVRMALNDAANAHENIRFAKYVRAQVRDILGLSCITGAASTTEATAGSFRIENQTGRNGKTGDLVMSNGKHNFVLVLISDRKAWQQKGYTPKVSMSSLPTERLV